MPFPVVHALDHRCCFATEAFPGGPSVGPSVLLWDGNLSRWSIRWTIGAALQWKPFPVVHPLDHLCNLAGETFPGGPFVGPSVQLCSGNLSRWSIRWTTCATLQGKPFPVVHPLDHRCNFAGETFPGGPRSGPPGKRGSWLFKKKYMKQCDVLDYLFIFTV